jgi:hypothetical protein
LPATACTECGYDYDGLDTAGLVAALEGMGRRYGAPLTRFLPGEVGDTLVRNRPQPDVWSALEYACHVRDTLTVTRARLLRALVFDRADMQPMGMYAWADLDDYNASAVDAVLFDLGQAADALAGLAGRLTADQWDRTLVYHWPETADRTVRWLVSHEVHEGNHHLLDVGRVLRQSRGR